MNTATATLNAVTSSTAPVGNEPGDLTNLTDLAAFARSVRQELEATTRTGPGSDQADAAPQMTSEQP